MNMFNTEYLYSDKIMNPTMTKKLDNLKNIMDLIIDSQEPSNAFSLFKLLNLDLSPDNIRKNYIIYQQPGNIKTKERIINGKINLYNI